MANVKKAFTGEVRDLVDPYVDTSFAGQRVRFFFIITRKKLQKIGNNVWRLYFLNSYFD